MKSFSVREYYYDLNRDQTGRDLTSSLKLIGEVKLFRGGNELDFYLKQNSAFCRVKSRQERKDSGGRTQAFSSLVGAMRTEQAAHERLTKETALAVFSSDALSSTAYATEGIFAGPGSGGPHDARTILLLCGACLSRHRGTTSVVRQTDHNLLAGAPCLLLVLRSFIFKESTKSHNYQVWIIAFGDDDPGDDPGALDHWPSEIEVPADFFIDTKAEAACVATLAAGRASLH